MALTRRALLPCRLLGSAAPRGLSGCRWASSDASAGSDVTTDATFRYRSFDWELSCGETRRYEYVVAQQQPGGETAQKTTDALAALEKPLPRPTTGWTVLLIPSVSLVCGGKEEMRPLASGLSQRGHRCYILEWPGWTADAQTNWALARCKPEEISAEYEDFWCQILEHVKQADAMETPSAAAPKICVVGAGHSAVYALRALCALRRERLATEGETADVYASLVMLAPTWHTVRRGMMARFSAARACRLLGTWLHGDSRVSRLFRAIYFSPRRFTNHFPHQGANDVEHPAAVARWLFKRPRPYVQTDAAALNGLLDPPGATSATEIASEAKACYAGLKDGALLLLPAGPASSSEGSAPAWDSLAASLQEMDAGVRQERLTIASPLPHEVQPTAVLFVLDSWLARGRAE
eukprot:gnl/TRDRNA2_/TRDRNA2_162248_c0_seq1.p1 gnl/TRDRNA2_/TRDRNA2_162248_c0~~gnl/TRDRNA2_/TRDRNA2_162248_c0_seq1.p1  ORF type:complete len:408 (-),score=55.11 gnl/TRDRNA2_/TRDRNA2_162248_c0_seq1:35-1258(-)